MFNTGCCIQTLIDGFSFEKLRYKEKGGVIVDGIAEVYSNFFK